MLSVGPCPLREILSVMSLVARKKVTLAWEISELRCTSTFIPVYYRFDFLFLVVWLSREQPDLLTYLPVVTCSPPALPCPALPLRPTAASSHSSSVGSHTAAEPSYITFACLDDDAHSGTPSLRGRRSWVNALFWVSGEDGR